VYQLRSFFAGVSKNETPVCDNEDGDAIKVTGPRAKEITDGIGRCGGNEVRSNGIPCARNWQRQLSPSRQPGLCPFLPRIKITSTHRRTAGGCTAAALGTNISLPLPDAGRESGRVIADHCISLNQAAKEFPIATNRNCRVGDGTRSEGMERER
jgi:hypothetical protein